MESALLHRLAGPAGGLAAARRELAWMQTHLVERRKLFPHTGRPRRRLNSNTVVIGPTDSQRLEAWVSDRCTREKPLQYILSTQPFAGWDVAVRRPTLIPRWETEEWVVDLAEKCAAAGQPLRIADLGCGTGCIGLTLAARVPGAKIVSLDISPRALMLARVNHRRLQETLGRRLSVEFHLGDMLSNDSLERLTNRGRFDVVVSNPPYIPASQTASVDRSVRDWEDSSALFSSDPLGVSFHMYLAEAAPRLLLKPRPVASRLPSVVLEFDGPQQASALCAMVAASVSVEIQHDSAGRERVANLWYSNL